MKKKEKRKEKRDKLYAFRIIVVLFSGLSSLFWPFVFISFFFFSVGWVGLAHIQYTILLRVVFC